MAEFCWYVPLPLKTPQNTQSCPPLPNQAGFRICQSEVQSFRKAEVCSSIFLVTVQLESSPTNLCMAWQVPTKLCRGLHLLTPDLMACSYYKPHGFPLTHQTSQPAPVYTFSDHMASSSLSLSLPLFSMLGQNFLCGLISSPSYHMPFLPSTPISLVTMTRQALH